MRKWLLTLCLLCGLVAPPSVLAFEEQILVIPPTTTTSAVYTYSSPVQAFYFRMGVFVLNITAYSGTNQIRSGLEYWNEVTQTWYTVDFADYQTSTGRFGFVFGRPTITSFDTSFVSASDRNPSLVTNKIRFWVQTTTADSATFNLQFYPLNSAL